MNKIQTNSTVTCVVSLSFLVLVPLVGPVVIQAAQCFGFSRSRSDEARATEAWLTGKATSGNTRS